MLLILTLSALVGCSNSSNNPKAEGSDSGWEINVDSGLDSGWTETQSDGTHLFIQGCFILNNLDTIYDCSITTQFIFREPIDGLEHLNLDWSAGLTVEETLSGSLYPQYAELVDGDTNINSFRALWGWFGNWDTHEREIVVNDYIYYEGLTFREFPAGSTTACVATLDGEIAALHCNQFSTQTCNENWEAELPGLTCDEINSREWWPLADDHPYFHGRSSE